MLPQHGMVNGDGVRDEGDLVGGRPSHAVELVVLIGECQGLNLHHPHPLHGSAKPPSKMMIGPRLSRKRRLGDIGSEVFVPVANGKFLDQINRMQEIKSPSWHGEHQFVGSRTSDRHCRGLSGCIVGCGLPAFKSAAHALNRGVNFFIGEGPSQQVFHEFFRHSMCFSSAVRCGDGTAGAGRDFDGFDGAAPLCQLNFQSCCQ